MSGSGGEFVIVLDATVALWSSVLAVFESNCGLTSVMQISQAGCLPPIHNVGAWLHRRHKAIFFSSCGFYSSEASIRVRLLIKCGTTLRMYIRSGKDHQKTFDDISSFVDGIVDR